MERNVAELDGTRREVRISLTNAELKPHYEKAYVEAQAGIEMKGFRKGKVPLALVKQHYGRQIEADALETIADTNFREFVTAERIHVLGSPALTDIAKSGDGVEFTIRYEVVPSFELGDYRGLVVNRPIKTVTDADVETEIDRIRLRAASFAPAEEASDAMHIATFSMTELDAETSMPILGKEAREERVFLDDDNVDMHLRNSLMNTKVGDTFSYVAETTEETAVPPSFRVTVTDIQQVIPAEFTNDFVEQITGGRFKTTEELRADITTQLQTYFTNAGREQVENQIVDQLVQAHSFDAPHSLVHSVVHQLFDDFKRRNEGAPGIEKLTAHDLEDQLKPTAERIVRWELIREKIIEAENLEITDADFAAAAERYGMTEDQLRMLVRQNNSVITQLLAEKAIDALIDYAIINDVNVDADTIG
ncbi:MAG: trigger factor [Candidatus Kapabacteria bacterium]|nr:trigger factor [Candidatus Kapabacteria bacterium]